MIRIRVPKDIRDYKEQFLFGLTARHLLCLSVGLLIGVPTVWFLKDKIPTDMLSYIVLGLLIFVIFGAVLKMNGLTFEQIVLQAIHYYRTGGKKGKKFSSQNVIRDIENDAPKIIRELLAYIDKEKQLNKELYNDERPLEEILADDNYTDEEKELLSDELTLKNLLKRDIIPKKLEELASYERTYCMYEEIMRIPQCFIENTSEYLEKILNCPQSDMEFRDKFFSRVCEKYMSRDFGVTDELMMHKIIQNYHDEINEGITSRILSFGKFVADNYEKEEALKMAVLDTLRESVYNDENLYFGDLNQKLRLVKTIKGSDGTGNSKNIDKNEERLARLAEKVEAIEDKRKEDPYYNFTAAERKTISDYHKLKEKIRTENVKKAAKIIGKKDKKMAKRQILPNTLSKTVQGIIPYIADYDDGIFEVEHGVFNKVYELRDLNFATAKKEDQETIIAMYSEFLNHFSDDMNISITIDTRIVSRSEQEQKIFYKMVEGDDVTNKHRKEYNSIIKKQMERGRSNMAIAKYITVTINAKTPAEACMRFFKIDSDIETGLKRIDKSCGCTPLSTNERLTMLHDKFRKGREGELKIDYKELKKRGLSSKDYIAPTSIHMSVKDFMIEDTYYRSMFLNNLPSDLDEAFYRELIDVDFPLTSTINIQPVIQKKAVNIVIKRLTGMDANKLEAEKKGRFINRKLRQSIEDAEQLYDDVTKNGQKLFYVTIMFLVSADTLDELNARSALLEGKVNEKACALQCLDLQQEVALRSIIPGGIPPKGKLFVDRVLTSESTAIFLPFSCQEKFDPTGFYYGFNQVSRNIIFLDRLKLRTPSGFLLGSSGSGKSFATKREILNVLLKDKKSCILIIDPENEYTEFVKAFGGVVLDVSADSSTYINPMEMTVDYGLDENDGDNIDLNKKKKKALQKKSDYIMSIVECMISMGSSHESIITPQQRTIVDRAVTRCYQKYLDSNFNKEYMPTLQDLQDELDKERDSEDGVAIAEAVEYYTKGNMDVFSHLSNVNLDNRIISFNIRDLGSGQLNQIALLIVLDYIWNRMTENQGDNIRTYCYVDEIHVLFQNELSATYLQQLYKRGRKYGLVITGITQDMEDLLRSEKARGMIANSDFIMMLNQKSENQKILVDMLNISDAQLSFITNVEPGNGLIFADKSVIPFMDKFPKESYLFELMHSDFGNSNTKAEKRKEKVALTK